MLVGERKSIDIRTTWKVLGVKYPLGKEKKNYLISTRCDKIFIGIKTNSKIKKKKKTKLSSLPSLLLSFLPPSLPSILSPFLLPFNSCASQDGPQITAPSSLWC